MMMRRIWLAAVLGIIIGLGIAAFPGSIGSQEKSMVPLTALNQPQRFEAVASSSQQLQFIFLGLIVGLVVAAPIFLLAKSKYK